MKATFRLTAIAAVLALIGLGAPTALAAKKTPTPAPTPAASPAAAPVDVNSADEKALASLPGVGDKTAKEIIKGRPYKSVDDLAKVKGIGEKKLAKLKPLVTVGGAPAAAPAAKPSRQEAPLPSRLLLPPLPPRPLLRPLRLRLSRPRPLLLRPRRLPSPRPSPRERRSTSTRRRWRLSTGSPGSGPSRPRRSSTTARSRSSRRSRRS